MASDSEQKPAILYPPFIRILHLSPSTGNTPEDTTLVGTLSIMSLDKPEVFDAISYACGVPPIYDHQVFVDEKKIDEKNIDEKNIEEQKDDRKKIILVTKNCHDGLRHLRDQVGVRNVWVDAVCIEANVEEKNEQLPLMTKIYAAARKVYVWIGLPSPACDRALDWLNDASISEHALLGARLALFPDLLRPIEIRRALPVFADILRARLHQYCPTRPICKCVAEDLEDVTGREWFTRQWIIQEAAMASEAWAVCGTRKIRFTRLVFGLVKAYEQRPSKEDLTKLDPIRAMFIFWTSISSASYLRVSPHRRWLNTWFCFGERSALRQIWMALLDWMEDYGWQTVKAQLAIVATIATIRLLQGLRPLNSYPLLRFIIVCFITSLITPPKGNPRWDTPLRKSIVEILRQTRRQEVTDKKDKVYALHGLLKELGVKDLEKPDYRKAHSLEDTYRSFTASLIIWHRSLEILLEAAGPWGTDAPSWVPDWSTTYERVQYSREELETPPTETHEAFEFCKDLRRLKVSGQKIGNLVFVGKPIERGPGSLNQISKNFSTLRDWLKGSSSTYGFSTHQVCCFLASAFPELRKCSTDDLHTWANAILEDEPLLTEREQDDADLNVLNNPGRRVSKEIHMLGLHLRPGLDGASWRRLSNLATNRKTWQIHSHVIANLGGGLALFVAQINDSESFLLGVGPMHIQYQDDVVQLASPPVPMVVRSTGSPVGDETYHLIGAAKMSHVEVTAEMVMDDREGRTRKFTLI